MTKEKQHNSAVNYQIINPKSMSKDQLYGIFDPVSCEWFDGVISKTFRTMACTENNQWNWIIFDGPINASCIENLETTLDDSKQLCLMSGEIITMSKTMNIIFEPNNLDELSPSIISRCGIIYMDSNKLGWEALHKSFIKRLPTYGINETDVLFYSQLVEWLIPATLEIISKCDVIVKISPLSQYKVTLTA